MSKTADYFLELQEYVYDAIFFGAQTDSDVREYIREFHPNFHLIESAMSGVLEDYQDQNWSEA